MPLDASNLPAFVSGDTVTAAAITARFAAIEAFFNGSIGSAEIETTRWVGAEQVIALEFYGSPNPRTIGQSFHAWHRFTPFEANSHFLVFDDFGTEPIPIPGLYATINVSPIDVDQGNNTALILANWFCWEARGVAGAAELESNAYTSALFHVYVDDTQLHWTERSLQISGNADPQPFWTRRAHSIITHYTDLDEGIHHIGVRVTPQAATDTYKSDGTASGGAPEGIYRDWTFIWIAPTSFHVEVKLL